MLARSLSLFLAVCALSGVARAADGGVPKVEPHRSATKLVSSNGRAVVGYDVTARKVSSFLEHPYKARSDGSLTRNLAYDAYFGLRVGGAGTAGTWLTDIAPSNVEYDPGSGIIHVARSASGLDLDEYVFAPIELDEHAFVSLLHAKRTSGSGAVDAYELFNFHLGSGSPAPSASQETVQWDATRDAWMEWGPSGLTLAYGSIAASSHHSASPQNPFSALTAGADLADNAGTGGSFDDAAAGLEWSLGNLAVGQEGWAGAFVVLDAQSNVAPRIDAVKSFIAGRTPPQLLDVERAAWKKWHTPAPSGLSADESALYQQQMAVLRMGQVRETGKPNGQILASLPPGNWNIAWVRDMAYASVALSRAGHTAEAKSAIQFQLGADSGKYQSEVGHPYQISITRYFGDGVEESDSNQDGPNIEFDGFGLFLWELDEYVSAAKDDASLTSWWPVVSSKVADVLVALQEANGLIAPDSSIWEVHWNGKQKHFAYTTITAANGLCRAASLADRAGDSAHATQYRDAGKKARDALISVLSAPDGTLAQSREELLAGSGFLDAAAIEAAGLGLVDPKGRAASATLASMRQKLVPASGRGFMRNDDGGWYDSQEWVFVDLRSANAMRLAADAEAPELLGWITAQGSDNFELISELQDATSADYKGEMPMVGFGAGAYALALLERASADVPLPCGEYATEGGNTDGGAGAGGSGGSGGKDGGAGSGGTKPKPAADDGGGCGCRLENADVSFGALLALGALAVALLRRRRS